MTSPAGLTKKTHTSFPPRLQAAANSTQYEKTAQNTHVAVEGAHMNAAHSSECSWLLRMEEGRQ